MRVYAAAFVRGAPLLAQGTDIRTIELLLGDRNVQTTIIYTDVHQVVRMTVSPFGLMNFPSPSFKGPRTLRPIPPRCRGPTPYSNTYRSLFRTLADI